MSAPAAVRARADAPPAPLRRSCAFELVKLLARWPVRIALALAWLAPAALVALISSQSSLPSDTLFGRWMGQTGWAAPLVVLTFCSTWVLPGLTSVVAGDVFAGEDRLGTWRHLLVAVRSPRRIFAAKVLAGLAVVLLLVLGLAASSVVGGLAAAGDRPLPGLDGRLLSPGQAAGAVALAWGSALAPTLAFAAVGVLGSVALGRSPLGLATPALLALALQLAQVLPLPLAVRVALPSSGFVAWRDLLADPAQTGPLLLAIAVAVGWAVVATALAYGLFVRRDFTDLADDGSGRRVIRWTVAPLAALLAATVAVLAASGAASGSGIERGKLERALATSFGHLYRLQTTELHRPGVTEAQLRARASCDKGGPREADDGAGTDWRCVVTWHLPGSAATGSAVYQLSAAPDGRWVADGDGPQEVNGFFTVRTPAGDAPNPLWQVDGTVDLLAR